MSSHPVNDFLTPDVVNFLQEFEQGTISQSITILFGRGANGKTIFTKFLGIIKTMEYVACGKMVDIKTISSIRTMINKCEKKPDIILLCHDEQREDLLLESLTSNEILAELKNIGIPVIVIINSYDPVEIIGYQEFLSKIKILYFNNLYSINKEDQLLIKFAKIYGMIPKQQLDEEDIINGEGIDIIKNIMCSKKRRRIQDQEQDQDQEQEQAQDQAQEQKNNPKTGSYKSGGGIISLVAGGAMDKHMDKDMNDPMYNISEYKKVIYYRSRI
jgi:hypothetical protein